MKFGRRYLVDLLYFSAEIGELWPGSSFWGAKNSEQCKKIVALFSYIAWPSTMKFGTITGTGP